jgi:protein involved in polysaccharide export with SLBB domain
MSRFWSMIAFGIVSHCVLSGAAMGQTSTDAALRAASARITAGDRILLHVVREPELNDSVFVTERGEASFPKLGILNVSSLTIGELQDTLRARYGEFLRMPSLQIMVLRRIVVNGEVRHPNVYYVDVATTLREVIARAGGITENGNRSKVAVVREGRRIPVQHWESDASATVDLLSGDQVVVGRKNWLVINALPAISTAVVLGSFVLSLRK